MGAMSNQSTNAQQQNAPQSQDPGEMALSILQSAIDDDVARGAATEQQPQVAKGTAQAETSETPEVEQPEPDENPIVQALSKKEVDPKGLQNQHAALTRRAKALEAEKARIEQEKADLLKEKSELGKIDGISDMVAFVAKTRGISEADVWEDVVDQIKNNGKRSPTNKAVRVVEELRRDILGDRQKAEQQAREQEVQSQAEQAEQAVLTWKTEAVETVKKDAEKWPITSKIPARALAIAAYDVAEEYFQTTGIVPTHEQVLDYLEHEANVGSAQQPAAPNSQPAPATGNGGAKAPAAPPKQKAKTISNRDASESTQSKDPLNMTQEERDAAALRILQNAFA
jgi:hypothetical protein